MKHTILVTGSSRGIGRAAAERFAREGHRVALHCHERRAEADALCASLAAGGCSVMAVQGDVADEADVDRLFAQVRERFGPVDVLVNNAGITRDGLMMRMSEQDFDAVLATNLKGAFACMQAVMRPMMKQRWGRIVNLSSVVGLRGNLGQANYAASKAGLIGMSKSAAKELASRGITVNCVAPGFIETDMTAVLPESVRTALLGQIPLARLGTAEEVAAAVAFLASPESAYITGQVLCVDGGMAM